MFWFMNRVLNPILIAILRGPLHGLLGGNLLALTYTGKKSGRGYTLVANYFRGGRQVYIIPAMPEQKTWWRNLVGGTAVDLTLAGGLIRQASAQALQMPADADQILPALAKLAATGAKPFGVPADGSPPPAGFVLVQVAIPSA